MKVFKFKDEVDGNCAFVVAANTQEAWKAIERETNLPLMFLESRFVEHVEGVPDKKPPFVWINQILPF